MYYSYVDLCMPYPSWHKPSTSFNYFILFYSTDIHGVYSSDDFMCCWIFSSRVVARNSGCDTKLSLANAIDLWYNESVDVFIGPPCSDGEWQSTYKHMCWQDNLCQVSSCYWHRTVSTEMLLTPSDGDSNIFVPHSMSLCSRTGFFLWCTDHLLGGYGCWSQ